MKTINPRTIEKIKRSLVRTTDFNGDFDRAYDRALSRFISKYEKVFCDMSFKDVVDDAKYELRALKMEMILDNKISDRRKGINTAYFFALKMLVESLENAQQGSYI